MNNPKKNKWLVRVPLTVGGVHSDRIRQIYGHLLCTGSTLLGNTANWDAAATDANVVTRYWRSNAVSHNLNTGSPVQNRLAGFYINAGKTVPTAGKNAPRAFGVLSSVYLGA